MNIIIVDDRNILLSELLLNSDATIFGVVLTTKVIYHTHTNDTVFHNSNFEKRQFCHSTLLGNHNLCY